MANLGDLVDFALTVTLTTRMGPCDFTRSIKGNDIGKKILSREGIYKCNRISTSCSEPLALAH